MKEKSASTLLVKHYLQGTHVSELPCFMDQLADSVFITDLEGKIQYVIPLLKKRPVIVRKRLWVNRPLS